MLAKTGRTLDIDGNVVLKFWPSLGIDMGKVTLSEHASKSQFAALDAAHVSIRLVPLFSGQVVADRVELDGLQLRVVRDAAGHLNIDDLLGTKKEDKTAAAPPPEFDIAGIHINNARLEWRDERKGQRIDIADLDFSTGHAKSGKDGFDVAALNLATRGKLDADNFDFSLDIPRLSRTAGQISAPGVDLSARLKGATRNATITLSLDKVDGSFEALKIGGVKLDIDARMGDKSIKGSLKTPLSFDAENSSIVLSTLAGTLDLDIPGLPKHPLQLPITGHIKADYSKPAVSGSLATAFDDSHIGTRFNVVGGSPPNIGIEVEIDKLNVDRYLPPPKDKVDKGGDDRIDLSALRSLNASGSLRVGELQLNQLKLRKLAVTFRASRGRLDIAPHSVDLYGGHLSGTASMDANGNRLALKENLTSINVQPLLQDLTGDDMVAGHGDVSVDVLTHGATVTAMKKALSGSARAVLRDGAIKGINIAQSLRNAKAKLGGDVSQAANATDKTDFSELSASFRIASGVAHNDDLSAKSPFLRLGGSGDIDIGNSQLNYLLKASLVSTAAGQGGKEADALKGVTVPVRVTGPFEKPGFKLEFGSLVSDAAKARLEEKQQQIKQQVNDKLKGQLKGQLDGKLKGLFGK